MFSITNLYLLVPIFFYDKFFNSSERCDTNHNDALLYLATRAITCASADDGRALRTKKNKMLAGPLPELKVRKPRKQLTPEELAERKKKVDEFNFPGSSLLDCLKYKLSE